MKKKLISVTLVLGLALLLGMAVGRNHSALAGPLDDLKKLGDDINKTKDTVDKYVEPAKDLYDASKPWPYPEERASGRVLAARVASHFGGVWKDQAWTNYVNLIGRGLVPYSNRPDIKYRFAILNTDTVNAYSCPGGYIFITKGLLKIMDNEDQLAGVLSHEIGHISQRHIEKAVKQEKALGAVLKGGLTFANSQGAINGEQKAMIEQLSQASWDVLITKGLSQNDEFEADRVAAETMSKMGYNPKGVTQVLEKLGAMSGDKNKMEVLLSTHPPADKRVKEVDKSIASKGLNTGKATLDKRFADFKAKHPL